MELTNRTVQSAHSVSNVTSAVHPSKLDYIIIDSKEALPIPALMFALGVFGNGLAIVSLLMYKYRRARPHSPITCSSVCTPSPNLHDNRDISAHEATTSDVQRRRSSALRNKCDYGDYKRTRRKHTFGPFHTLVLALLSVDLAGNLATAPITLFLYSTNTTILAAGGNSLCHYSAFAMMFFGIVTMASLTTMAIERVLSIQCAYYYHRHITTRTANIAVLIILITCTVFASLPAMGFGKVRPMFPYTWCFADWQAEEPKDMAFNFIYAFSGILMIFTTFICNITVVIGLFQMKSRMSSSRSRKHSVRRETQMIIQLLVMTFIYLVCWLPLMIRILDNQVTRQTNGEKDRMAIWLAAANPILDPWVYILLRRSVVKRLVTFAKSVCFPQVQSKLRIVVYHASSQNNNKSPQMRGKEKDAAQFLMPVRHSQCSASLPANQRRESHSLQECRNLSASCESLYDNAPPATSKSPTWLGK